MEKMNHFSKISGYLDSDFCEYITESIVPASFIMMKNHTEYYGHLTFYFWRHLLAPMGIWHYSPDNDYEMFFFTINHLIDSLLKKNHFLCLKNANINY